MDDRNPISRRQLLRRAGAVGAGMGLGGLFGRPFFLAAAQEGADPPPATRVTNPLRGLPSAAGRASTATSSARTRRSSSPAPRTTRTTASSRHTSRTVSWCASRRPTAMERRPTSRAIRPPIAGIPRCCQKGLILGRRIYGDRRVKAPQVRKGFKDWVEARLPPPLGREPRDGHLGPRHRRLRAGDLGRGRRHGRQGDARHRNRLQRRGRSAEAHRAGLRPGDGRGHPRLRACRSSRCAAGCLCWASGGSSASTGSPTCSPCSTGSCARTSPGRRSSAPGPSTTTPGTRTCRRATRW